MKKRTKLLLTICTMGLAIACCIGFVYATLTISYTVNTSFAFVPNDNVLVTITGSISNAYTSTGTAITSSTANAKYSYDNRNNPSLTAPAWTTPDLYFNNTTTTPADIVITFTVTNYSPLTGVQVSVTANSSTSSNVSQVLSGNSFYLDSYTSGQTADKATFTFTYSLENYTTFSPEDFGGKITINKSSGPAGSAESNPIMISSTSEWNSVLSGDTDGKYYKLEEGVSIAPTSTISSFAGHLDGAGNSVYLTEPMFNTLKGSVENLTLSIGAEMSTGGIYGLLANTASGATVDSVSVIEGEVYFDLSSLTSLQSYVGVLCGRATNSTFMNCVVGGNAEGTGFIVYMVGEYPRNMYFGGIAGYSSNSTFLNCSCVLMLDATEFAANSEGYNGYMGYIVAGATSNTTVQNCLGALDTYTAPDLFEATVAALEDVKSSGAFSFRFASSASGTHNYYMSNYGLVSGSNGTNIDDDGVSASTLTTYAQSMSTPGMRAWVEGAYLCTPTGDVVN